MKSLPLLTGLTIALFCSALASCANEESDPEPAKDTQIEYHLFFLGDVALSSILIEDNFLIYVFDGIGHDPSTGLSLVMRFKSSASRPEIVIELLTPLLDGSVLHIDPEKGSYCILSQDEDGAFNLTQSHENPDFH